MAGGCVKCIRYLVFVFNFMFWLLGLGILGFGIYLRVDPNIGQIVGATPTQDLYVIAYVLIGIGSVMTVVGFLGCCGAYQESTCLLGTFFACLLVIFAAQIAAGVVGYLKQDDMVGYWNKTLTDFVITYGWANSTAQTTAMNAMQRSFACCGANGPADYRATDWYKNQAWLLYYPSTCCDSPTEMVQSAGGNLIQTIGGSNVNVNLNQGLNVNVQAGTTAAPKMACLIAKTDNYKDGCISKSVSWCRSQWLILLIVGIVILLVELLGMIFGITLCCSVRRRNDAYDGYDQPESQNLVS